MAGRAALAQLVERHVGGLGGAGRRLERVGVPADVDLLGLPRTAGENGGRRRHALHRSEGASVTATVSRVSERRLKHWGWGYEDEQPSHEEVAQAAAYITGRLGFGSTEPERPVPLSEVVAARRRG